MSIFKVLLPAALVGGAVLALSSGTASAKAPADRQLTAAQSRAIEQALATADPRAIRELASDLERAGFKQQASDLREAADAIERAVKNVPPVKPGDKPVITTGGTSVGLPPVATTGTPPEALSPAKVLAGKTALMLTNSSPGRESKSLVTQYQQQEQSLGHATVGKADGMYGPKTALTLAKFYGIVPPTPYYWPRVGRSDAVAAYRAELLTFAAKDPPRAEEWRAAANVR